MLSWRICIELGFLLALSYPFSAITIRNSLEHFAGVPVKWDYPIECFLKGLSFYGFTPIH